MPRRSGGVALISVLLIVAILIAVASRLMLGQNLTISQHQNVFEQNQALQYALGAETLARQVLRQDLEVGGAESDHLGEIWAQPVLPFDLDEGGFMEAKLTDLNGCMNLNTVIGNEGQASLESLKRLLTSLGVQPNVADAWRDWIDGDTEVNGFGAEDSEYLIAEIPHRTPNAIVTHLSELSLLANVTREEVELITPHVCLLPDPDTQLNVNTANAASLAALVDGQSPEALEALVTGERAYASKSDFINEYNDFAAVEDRLSVKSEYFALHAVAQVGDSSVTLYTVMRRDPNTGEITVLSRDFGRLFVSDISETDA